MAAVNRPERDEQLIGALIPDRRRRPETARTPLPELPAARLRADDLILDVARLDRSGRLSARGVLAALGWEPGARVWVDAVRGSAVIGRSSAGRGVVDPRGSIAVPIAVRDLCGIAPGDSVVLAASPSTQRLLVHPAAVVARLVADLHLRLLEGQADDR